MVKVGFIGGTGLEKLNILQHVEEITVETPYGDPSSSFYHGMSERFEVYILSRHGRDHSIPPTQVNYRANIHALKELGCQYLIATTACGSLREDIHRGDLVIPDQFIDFTKLRKNTFFDHFNPGQMGHTPMADPFNKNLRELLINHCQDLKLSFHSKGTVVTIEGPRFSTRAESKMFRLLGADIVNMSIATETSLANEAGIPYAVIALSTDYDSWKNDEEPVTWDSLLLVFQENVKHVTNLLMHILKTDQSL